MKNTRIRINLFLMLFSTFFLIGTISSCKPPNPPPVTYNKCLPLNTTVTSNGFIQIQQIGGFNGNRVFFWKLQKSNTTSGEYFIVEGNNVTSEKVHDSIIDEIPANGWKVPKAFWFMSNTNNSDGGICNESTFLPWVKYGYLPAPTSANCHWSSQYGTLTSDSKNFGDICPTNNEVINGRYLCIACSTSSANDQLEPNSPYPLSEGTYYLIRVLNVTGYNIVNGTTSNNGCYQGIVQYKKLLSPNCGMNGYEDPLGQCTCLYGYYGPSCVNNAQDCSFHGHYTEAGCVCDEGYHGEYCQYSDV
ncbi:MAG: hypothetical protein HQK49_17715 [Oligoflexia bacterium]|nr:hypothetical protein [Oligoflexia bacterium]